MTRTLHLSPLPHRAGRRYLPVLAAFVWAVVLHVAVAAGLAGLAGQPARPEAESRGFRLVQVPGQPAQSQPAPTESETDQTSSEPNRSESPQADPQKAPATQRASRQSPATQPTTDPPAADGPALKTKHEPVKKAVAKAEPAPEPEPEPASRRQSRKEPAGDTAEPEAQADSGPPKTASREPARAEEPRTRPAPEASEDPAGSTYQPPGIRRGSRRNAPPAYPAHARRRGVEGTVILLVHVGPDGRPRRVEVDQSSGHTLLDRAARRAVQKWSFRPATRGGREVAGSVKVPVRFQLRS
jgi:protein TonB